MIRHCINVLLVLLPPSHLFRFRNALLRLGGLEVARGAKYCGRGWIYGRGPVRIGAHSWLSPGVVLYTHEKAPITIGERCDVGPGVEFITGSHEKGGPSRRAGPGTAAAIAIGDGCWIGAGSRILGGVTVGHGAVVAAGSIVIRDVDPDTMVAGVPAIVKRRLVD